MSGLNGAGLTLRAALATHRWKTSVMREVEELERAVDGAGGEDPGGEPSGEHESGRGATRRPDDRKESSSGNQRAAADGGDHVEG